MKGYNYFCAISVNSRLTACAQSSVPWLPASSCLPRDTLRRLQPFLSFSPMQPGELLKRHNLMHHLALHRRSSPTSTVNTLADSMSNLKIILGEGESIMSFRTKVKKRTPGRVDDSTLTGSSGSDLTTVLCKTQTMKKKTVKKVPSVPKKPAPEVQPPDDSLSKPVLSSFRSTLMQAVKKRNPKVGHYCSICSSPLSLSSFNVAKHISVGRLFKNIHPSLQYTSRSLIHASLYDFFFFFFFSHVLFFPRGHSIHIFVCELYHI